MADYDNNVFINCPFDLHYQPLEDAIIFTVIDCGFRPRSAKESSGSTIPRLQKIQSIIGECKLAIHDVSRTELDSQYNLPRFNMPFELGLFLGASYYGGKKHKTKECLIFDVEKHRYEKYLSDIKGHDIQSHHNSAENIIRAVRDFLAEVIKNQKIYNGKEIIERYKIFLGWMTKHYYDEKRLSRKELSFGEFVQYVSEFLKSIEEL